MGERRNTNRKKRRMPCELRVGDRTHSVLVLDLSPTGLFIQTTAKCLPGQTVEMTLSTGEDEPILLRAEVVRKKVVPPRLLAVAGGGVGVRILDAPEAYYAFLDELGIGRDPAPPAELAAEDASAAVAEAGSGRFRVRIKQTSGPRSRSVLVAASDAAAASALALEEMGEDWKVLDVEPA